MVTGRNLLPHQTDRLFITDGGIETWLMYKRGFELKHFSAFDLMNDARARDALRDYYRQHAEIALKAGVPFVFDSLTYRSSSDWGRLLGYSSASLAEMHHRIFDLYREVAAEMGSDPATTLYGGCMGPRGDAYETNTTITAESAEDYHAEEIATFVALGADFITGLTLKSVPEAIGIARAAKAAGIAAVISFTLDKAGKVDGLRSLKTAIHAVDVATDNAPAFYMINCSHPVDFVPSFEQAPWMSRLRGLRANASSLAHGVLCQLGHLEEGDPEELGQQHGEIVRDHSQINFLGGCCGTDAVHVGKICDAAQRARSNAPAGASAI